MNHEPDPAPTEQSRPGGDKNASGDFSDLVSEIERIRPSWLIDYRATEYAAQGYSSLEKMEFFAYELPHLWKEAYWTSVDRPAELFRIESGTFSYVFDDFDTMVAMGNYDDDGVSESRLVAAFGRSLRRDISRKHDDSRLKGWLVPTEKRFGKGFDKGHFIAHTIGGAVDRSEYNVYPQLRKMNRGHSEAGKRYVKMEKYCRRNEGTFCFSRPIYLDSSSRPAMVEYGVLTSDSSLWAEIFDNRSSAFLAPGHDSL